MSEFLDNLDVAVLNKYQINKRNWLMDSNYYTEATIMSYWKALENNSVNVIELAKGRDLFTFSTPEIIEVLNYAPTIREGSKSSLLTIITKYEQWACDRRFNLTGNPCYNINVNDIKINMTAFKMSYIPLDDFYEFLDTIKTTDIDKMILVLGRYGVGVGDMGNIRWEDVDRENMVVDIVCKSGTILHFPIDNRFLGYVDKAKDELGYKIEGKVNKKSNSDVEYKAIDKYYTTEYSDLGYILKVTPKMSEGQMKENTIRNRIYEISTKKSLKGKNVKRPKVTDYNKSRLYDLLFDVLDEKGEVIYQDVKDVVGIFKEKVTVQKSNSLKKNFEMISGVTVITKKNQYKLKQD